MSKNQHITEKYNEAKDKTVEWVKNNPKKALGIGGLLIAGVFYLLGTRRRKE